MPRTPEQNNQIRQQRKNQILTAAFDVYTEKGFQSMEMGDVAQKADIGRGTLYHYYNNKTMLMRDVFAVILEEAKNTAAKTLNTNEKPLLRLKSFFRQELTTHLNHPLRYRFFKYFFEDVHEVYADNAEKILEEFSTNNYQPLMTTFQQAIDDGTIKAINPTRLTQLFWGAFIGMPAYIDNTDFLQNPQEWIEDAMTILFDGIKNHA